MDARSTRILYLFTAIPPLCMAALFFAGRVPERWRNLFFLATLGGGFATMIVITVRERFRAEREVGLAPKQLGFSRKLDAAAEQLRAFAAELELDPELEIDRVTKTYVSELRRVAKKQDKRELKVDYSTPATIREAAAELELYAQTIRMRGGIFKLDLMNVIAGAVVLLAGFVWGCRLIVRYWDRPSWSFFGGVFLIIACAGVGYGLYRSQRDGA